MNTFALQSKYPRLADRIAMLAEAIDGLDTVSPAQVMDWLGISENKAVNLLWLFEIHKFITPRYEITCPVFDNVLAVAFSLDKLPDSVECPGHGSHTSETYRIDLLFDILPIEN